MPHRSFFSSSSSRSEIDASPTNIDLLIDQPAAVAEHFDFALGVQAALTVCLIEAGLEVVPALETDPDPIGVPQLLYAEQPRSREEVWCEIAERNFEAAFMVQLQVYVTGRGVGLDARVGPQDLDEGPLTRIVFEPGQLPLDRLIDEAVATLLAVSSRDEVPAPGILDMVGADDAACLAMMIPTLGASIRFDLGEGGTPVHRELARAARGYQARDEATDAARKLMH